HTTLFRSRAPRLSPNRTNIKRDWVVGVHRIVFSHPETCTMTMQELQKEGFMFHTNGRLAFCFVLTCGAIWLLALPAAAATTNCQYDFFYSSNDFDYCVTVNGNIPQFYNPIGIQLLTGGYGEGYGICNESPAQNSTDYGSSDTGNWGNSTLVSKTATSVKITRTTRDGNWTLTQTITQASAKIASITVVMALTNNQSVNKVAYLVRYADAHPQGLNGMQLATVNSALSWTANGSG